MPRRSYSGISAKLEAIATQRKDAALRRLAQAVRAFEADFAEAMSQKGAWDYQALDAMVATIADALRRSGLPAIADEFGDAALSYAKTVDGSIKALTFTSSEANILHAAVNAKYDGWAEATGGRFTRWLRAKMAEQVVAPISTRDLVAQSLEYLEDRLKPYAQTYIDTALHQGIRDTWAVAGEAMGAVLWEYAGPPLIATSHEFCIEHLGDTLPLDEWRALDNGTDLPVVWSCAGWGCRHYLEPVPGD
ncbi:MAG: hypothetical protein ACOZEN_06800 [Thermodesulfobacteriota bacterium]